MIRSIKIEELSIFKESLHLEKDYILYNNLFLRSDRCIALAQIQNNERVLGSYLKGLPFHAFTFHVSGDAHYSVEDMLGHFKEEIGIETCKEIRGVITVNEGCLSQLKIPRIQSRKTMNLMKLTGTTSLKRRSNFRFLDTTHTGAVNQLTDEVGMMSYREEELTEIPHIGLFSNSGELVSMAGFHIYQDDYTEIGNIGTSPAYRNKGLGTQITSDICWVALEKSPNVYLFVFEDNHAAVNVYEWLGFSTAARYALVEFMF